MNTQEIANRLVELCRQGDFATCYAELFSPEIVSIEPEGSPMQMVTGLDGIKKKSEEWNKMVEQVHRSEIGDPVVGGNYFALPWKMNLTFKGAPGPTDMDEICVYEVRDGKIVTEQFFYSR
ncbi:MAG: nuclear transport factor 2 family protein [Saprospiraceae bacterium]|nr:nuclear transport factor 2 family protein [Saprospiraceae bacterium]